MVLRNRVALSTIVCVVACYSTHSASALSEKAGSKAYPVHQTVAKASECTENSALDVTFTDKELETFDGLFESFAKKSKAVIVAEGFPVNPVLSKTGVEHLRSQLSSEHNLSVGEIAVILADAFDYRAEQVSPQTILLYKRYTNPADLPCVTYEEVVQDLRSILRLCEGNAPLPPDEDGVTAAFRFYSSLTAEQKAVLPKGIVPTDLSPEQRSLAMVLADRMIMGTKTDLIRAAYSHLVHLQDKKVVFTYMTLNDKETFGYLGPFSPKGNIWHCPFTNGFIFQITGSYGYRSVPDHSAADSGSVTYPLPTVIKDGSYSDMKTPLPYDPALPTDLDRQLAPRMSSGRLHYVRTLREVARSVSLANSSFKVTVDDSIADKPICVFGVNTSKPKTFVEEVAQLYGLLVLVPDEHRCYITLPKPRALQAPDDFGKEVARLLPPSLTRYQDSQAANILPSLPKRSVPEGLSLEAREHEEATNKEFSAADARFAARSALYFPAVRQLRVLACPAVPSAKAAPVPVKSLGPAVERLIALIALSDTALNNASELKSFTPPACLIDPSRLCIQIQAFEKQGNQTLGVKVGERGARRHVSACGS